METELDLIPVSSLTDRYNIAKSNVYNRMEGLGIKPEKQGNKSFLNADQLALMDELEEHLKAGGAIADFNKGESSSYRPTGQIEQSYKTPVETISMANAIAGQIAAQVIDALKATQSAPQLPPADPLANIRALQEICEQGWHLSSSQLAPFLGLKALPSKEFERFGFKFVKAGKNGAESAWKVLKV